MACGMAWVWVMGVGGRSPVDTAGGGGEWGPHTKESIRCIPQSGNLKNQKPRSGNLKNQKESLLRSHRTA